mmetsp:Transcript_14956/g.58593  ORF Transcript_14956/g.58593 Transcript_14956/m.58593 type:complete len:335 (+) Transcript_14956:1313-2317(+)
MRWHCGSSTNRHSLIRCRHRVPRPWPGPCNASISKRPRPRCAATFRPNHDVNRAPRRPRHPAGHRAGRRRHAGQSDLAGPGAQAGVPGPARGQRTQGAGDLPPPATRSDRAGRDDARDGRLRGLPPAQGQPGHASGAGHLPDGPDPARGRECRFPGRRCRFHPQALQPGDRRGPGAHPSAAQARRGPAAAPQRPPQRRAGGPRTRGRAAARHDAVCDGRPGRVPRCGHRQPHPAHPGIRAHIGPLDRCPARRTSRTDRRPHRRAGQGRTAARHRQGGDSRRHPAQARQALGRRVAGHEDPCRARRRPAAAGDRPARRRCRSDADLRQADRPPPP